jgi:hypothetical protein
MPPVSSGTRERLPTRPHVFAVQRPHRPNPFDDNSPVTFGLLVSLVFSFPDPTADHIATIPSAEVIWYLPVSSRIKKRKSWGLIPQLCIRECHCVLIGEHGPALSTRTQIPPYGLSTAALNHA